MGLQHIAPIIEADHRRLVQHETFGHLFPKKHETFIGVIYIAESDYGDLIVLKDDSNVPSSPWWYHSLMDFTSEFLMKYGESGTVYKIQTFCKVIEDIDENDNKYETIEISNMRWKKVELK